MAKPDNDSMVLGDRRTAAGERRSGRGSILTFGKYEILEAVGSGGMATVYRARLSGPMGFEKPVAVKVLQDDAAEDEEIVRMFVDEASVGARLYHPNIAHVLEFGEADGRYFLAMEYVDGPSLSLVLKRRQKGRKARGLGPQATAYVAGAVLEALAYAHESPGADGQPMGVVHRDVSPQNVLLDRSGAVKLCDFGIATGTWRAGKTRIGVVKGKAGYMAPEQATGGKVDARSDLYAVGLTMVAMLTGEAPFDGKDTGEIRARAAKGFPPERLGSLPCDDALKDVLGRALATRAGDRYASAREFLRALEAAVPDPDGAGRKALAEAIAAAMERPAGRKAAAAGTAARPKNARGKAARPGRKAATVASAASGVRNLLIGAGILVLVALALALAGKGLPG